MLALDGLYLNFKLCEISEFLLFKKERKERKKKNDKKVFNSESKKKNR